MPASGRRCDGRAARPRRTGGPGDRRHRRARLSSRSAGRRARGARRAVRAGHRLARQAVAGRAGAPADPLYPLGKPDRFARPPPDGAPVAGLRLVRRLVGAGSHRSVGRRRLRRLRLGADHDRRPPAPAAVHAARTECRAGQGQSPGAGRRGAHRDLVRPHASHRRRRSPRASRRQSGARDRAGAAQFALSCARRGQGGRSRGLRRQPGRGLVQPGRAGGRAVPAGAAARAPAPGPAVPAGGSRAGAPALRPGRHRGRAGALLRRPAAAHRRRASRDRPRRRFDRGRARRHRPAVDPGALSLCRGRSSDGQCPRFRGGRRLHRDPARRLHGQNPGRASGGPGRDAATAGRHGGGRSRRGPARCGGAPCRPGRRNDRACSFTVRSRRMRAMPLDLGLIHFVGIGGIGMSGIAEVLHNLGYKVQGSDIAEGANTRRLAELGIRVAIGHRADNIASAQVVVVSSAVKKDNPEVLAARARLLPVVRRAEMLGELMRLKWSIAVGGTHGKTTTTSLVAAMLDAGGLDPTVINGGIINAYGTNARLGEGDWMVVESDESDGSFLRLPATIAVVTNVDPEHLDHYGTFDALRDAFVRFVENIPFYGFAVLCFDHPEVQALIPRVADRRIITYGLGANADVRAINLRLDRGGADFDVVVENRATNESRVIVDMRLPMFGQHNVQNALAAIAVAQEMGLPDDTIRRALGSFAGVKRRFTKTGEAHGITVIDDYGHHPVEIAAVLRAARQAYGGSGRVIAVMQPHRYTRLGALKDEFAGCFSDADAVLIAEVYAAGETPIAGVNRDMLVNLVRRAGHRDVTPLGVPGDLPGLIWQMARPGDVVVFLGAGNITAWAHALPGQIQQMAAEHAGPRAIANDHGGPFNSGSAA